MSRDNKFLRLFLLKINPLLATQGLFPYFCVLLHERTSIVLFYP